jgi:hypothetical protein
MMNEEPLRSSTFMLWCGLVLLLLSGALLSWGISFDPSVSGDPPDYQRIINTGLLATKNTIFLVACTTFVSAWIAFAAGHVSLALDRAYNVEAGPSPTSAAEKVDVAGHTPTPMVDW